MQRMDTKFEQVICQGHKEIYFTLSCTYRNSDSLDKARLEPHIAGTSKACVSIVTVTIVIASSIILLYCYDYYYYDY